MSGRYTLLPISAERREEWDAFVSQQRGGHLLQTWSWGELKASASWHPLRLALWDMETRSIRGAAQVLRRTLPYVPPRMGHLAYVPKGPVVDWTRSGDGSAPSPGACFLTQLSAYLRRRGALALQVEPAMVAESAESSAMLGDLRGLGFHPTTAVQPLRTILLDITPAEESLLAHMKEKWRYNVRLAMRKGVEVRVAEAEEEVRAWYGLMQTTSERDRFGIHTLDYYVRAWRLLATKEAARLFLAYAGEQLLAGIFVGLAARQAIYLYGASGNEQRQLMPNYLLQWEAIRWAKRRGATTYDFWGIPPTDEADEAMAGVYRFKSGWGGSVTTFEGNYERAFFPGVMNLVRARLG